MTKFRGTLELNFSVESKDEFSARDMVLSKIVPMLPDDLLNHIRVQCIDNSSPKFAKWFFADPDDERFNDEQ